MRLILLAFSIAPLAMLGVAPSALAATQTDAASEIRNVLKSQQDAWNRGDINAFMNGYWHSDQTVFVSGDEVSRGWQKVLDRYETKYSDHAKMGTLTFSDLGLSLARLSSQRPSATAESLLNGVISRSENVSVPILA